jgi:hypothetical protein
MVVAAWLPPLKLVLVERAPWEGAGLGSDAEAEAAGLELALVLGCAFKTLVAGAGAWVPLAFDDLTRCSYFAHCASTPANMPSCMSGFHLYLCRK